MSENGYDLKPCRTSQKKEKIPIILSRQHYILRQILYSVYLFMFKKFRMEEKSIKQTCVTENYINLFSISYLQYFSPKLLDFSL